MKATVLALVGGACFVGGGLSGNAFWLVVGVVLVAAGACFADVKKIPPTRRRVIRRTDLWRYDIDEED